MIIKRIIFLVPLMAFHLLPAQDNQDQELLVRDSEEGKEEIKTLSRSNHRGGFAALSFRASGINGSTAVFTGFRAGWIANRSVGIGFEVHGLLPTAKYDNVDPVYRTVLLGGYGGMFLEPIFFSNEVVHVTFPLSGGAGWFGYRKDWGHDYDYSNSMIDTDMFWYVEPGISAELNVSRNFRLAAGISKRFTQDLQLADTPEEAYEKLNYFLTLKFGKF